MKVLWTLSAALLFSGTLLASGAEGSDSSRIFGSWSEPCSVLENGKGSIGITYSFTGNDFFSDNLIINGNVYSDTGCRHIALSHIFYGQYRTGGRYGDGFSIDLAYDRRFVSGYHIDDVHAMNQLGYCGHSDWRFGISKLVSLSACDRAWAGKIMEKAASSISTIYDVRTSKGYSYVVFGKSSKDGSRPTRLDLSRKFIKQ